MAKQSKGATPPKGAPKQGKLSEGTEDRRAARAVVLQPSVRTYRLWTPAQLKLAESMADTGSIRLAVDLCDWLLGDDKTRGALDGRINGLLGLPLEFKAQGDGRRKTRAVNALEAEEDWRLISTDSEVRQILAWSLLLNLGTGFNKWKREPDHGDRDVPRITFYHPQPLSYDWNARTWMRENAQDNEGQEPIQFGDGTWFAHMPFGSYRPWSMGLWRGIARWALLKAYAISDWGRLGETATRNVVEEQFDPNREEPITPEISLAHRQELASDLRDLKRESAILLPVGFSYRLVETTAATREIFEKQITFADTAIAIAIRNSNLTTNVASGSLAAAEVQERTGDGSNRKADASAWADTTHNHTLVFWAADNFGDSKLAPRPVYQADPPEDLKTTSESLDVAMDALTKAQALGFEIDHQKFADKFNVEDFLKAPKPGTELPKATPAPAAEPAAKRAKKTKPVNQPSK